MKKKAGFTIAAVAAAAAALLAATVAGGASASATASPLCKQAGIGFAGPLSGPAAFLGTDQHSWVTLFLNAWNAGKKIPGVPASLKRVPIKDALEGDSQLNPQVSATVAAQMISNKSILAMGGCAGSNENLRASSASCRTTTSRRSSASATSSRSSG